MVRRQIMLRCRAKARFAAAPRKMAASCHKSAIAVQHSKQAASAVLRIGMRLCSRFFFFRMALGRLTASLSAEKPQAHLKLAHF
jgi:hypothetical protein